MSRSVAVVERAAIAHNVGAVRAAVGDRPQLCAVVKADGYGHGAVEVARTALDAGATWLGVAHAAEGTALRAAGIEAPVLLLSEPVDAEEVDAVVAGDLRCAVYSPEVVDALAATGAPLRVHLKVDTGMRRVGAAPVDVPSLARRLDAAPRLELEGLWTHCAVADELGNDVTRRQLERFVAVVDALRRDGIEPRLRHVANSAACLTLPQDDFDLVRPGIALYGVAPAPALAGTADLRPALTWRSQVGHVKRVPAGEGVSYGHRGRTSGDTMIATVPVGYADGLARRWSLTGGVVLLGGVRRPIIGVVTMDQVMVDCGPAGDVARGDEVVLIGTQGDASIEVDELAAAVGTIAYEVLTGIGPRVARRHV